MSDDLELHGATQRQIWIPERESRDYYAMQKCPHMVRSDHYTGLHWELINIRCWVVCRL